MKKLRCMMVILLAVLLAAGLLSGCGGAGGAARQMVATGGSTSMEKVIGSLKEEFEAGHGDITVTYDPTGSGAGITAVAEGRCDIGLASRDLKQEELDQGLTGTVLAYDGIAVLVHPDNPVTGLSMAQLADIYTGAVTNWAELGGEDAEIVLIGREAGSGTRDGFETVTGTADRCAYRQELTSTGDVIATVAGNPAAIGYASLAAIKENVKVLAVDGVTPSEESVRDKSYPVQRNFVLVTRADTPLPDAAQQFFDYCVSAGAAEVIRDAGAVPVL